MLGMIVVILGLEIVILVVVRGPEGNSIELAGKKIEKHGAYSFENKKKIPEINSRNIMIATLVGFDKQLT